MIHGNLALKLEDFEDNYCDLHLVEDCEQNLPDNVIQFPTPDGSYVDYSYDDVNRLNKVITITKPEQKALEEFKGLLRCILCCHCERSEAMTALGEYINV
ncbi:hypothetical protein KAW08_03545 [bacterium]|nr:hypothetical protein [bacterium]